MPDYVSLHSGGQPKHHETRERRERDEIRTKLERWGRRWAGERGKGKRGRAAGREEENEGDALSVLRWRPSPHPSTLTTLSQLIDGADRTLVPANTT